MHRVLCKSRPKLRCLCAMGAWVGLQKPPPAALPDLLMQRKLAKAERWVSHFRHGYGMEIELGQSRQPRADNPICKSAPLCPSFEPPVQSLSSFSSRMCKNTDA